MDYFGVLSGLNYEDHQVNCKIKWLALYMDETAYLLEAAYL